MAYITLHSFNFYLFNVLIGIVAYSENAIFNMISIFTLPFKSSESVRFLLLFLREVFHQGCVYVKNTV